MRKLLDKVNQKQDLVAEEIFEEIHAITHIYRSRQHRQLREPPFALTHMESRVLGFFARNQDATLSDLISHSGRDKAQLTRLIRGLREKGLLEARVDENDRRSTLLQLSEEGKRIHRKSRAQGALAARRGVEGMSDEERRQLAAMLARIRTNLESDDNDADE